MVLQPQLSCPSSALYRILFMWVRLHDSARPYGQLGMINLTIDLQDGFSRDKIVVSIAGRVIYQQENLSTRTQIGFAASFSTRVADELVTLSFLFPDRSDKPQTLALTIHDDTYLGVSLNAEGLVVSKTSNTPFMYA